MEKTCTQLGMTINDSNENNHQILCDAINNGITIVFDGLYTIYVDSTIYLTNSVNIKSQSKDYGMKISSAWQSVFIFEDIKLANGVSIVAEASTEVVPNAVKMKNCKMMHRSSVIKAMLGMVESDIEDDPSGEVDATDANGVNVIIDGITITNIESDTVALVEISDNSEMNNIRITNCIFNDNIAAVRFYGPLDIDPANTNIGFNNFKFNYNEVNNNRTNFIRLMDMRFENVEICHNTIHNIDNVFANIGVTNEHEYQEEVPEYRKNAVITHNTVTCDDDWWHNSSTTTYMNFVLIENNKLYYAYNHVEGLKSRESVSLYDVYASSIDVTCEYNIWKNNLVFDPDCIYNVLMKAKGNNGYKRFYNNEYYAEESFVKKMGYTVDDLYLKLYDNVSEADWEIIGNKVDCCSLYGLTASAPFTRLVFEDNEIYAGKWDNSSLINTSNNTDLYVKNNVVTIEGIYEQFYLVMVPLTSEINSIDMQDNEFTLVVTSNTNQQLLYCIGANTAVIKNNTFDIYADVNITFEYYCEYTVSSDVTNNPINKKALNEYV